MLRVHDDLSSAGLEARSASFCARIPDGEGRDLAVDWARANIAVTATG
jgi:hypothetical protein